VEDNVIEIEDLSDPEMDMHKEKSLSREEVYI
jgi:hypothetical protein